MFRLLLLTIVGVVSICAIENVDDRRSITGKITGDDGLGGTSSVRVELRDPSSRETRAKLIGFTKISDVTSFPIPYEVNFNASDIIRDHAVELTASIRGPDGILRFVNQDRLRPDLNGPGPFAVDIHVKLSKATQELPSVCQPVDCRHEENLCPYGYLEKDGCQTCECNDPCYPSNKVMPCEFNRSCYVIQESNGAYRARCVPSRATNNHKNDKPSREACTLPVVQGPCRAFFPRYFHNGTTNACELFTYGGCQGNGNNFEALDECESLCGRA